jgi:hypothetical protein
MLFSVFIHVMTYSSFAFDLFIFPFPLIIIALHFVSTRRGYVSFNEKLQNKTHT